MRGSRVHQRPEHDLTTTGAVGLPSVEYLFHLLPLQPVLRAAEITGNDRIVHRAGEFAAIGLGHIGKRAIDEEVAFFVDELGRHGGEASAVKEVHEEGLKDIIAMMPEYHGRTPLFAGDAIEVPAPEPGAERAIGPARRHLVHDDGISVLIFDPVGNAHILKKFRQHRGREAGLSLIQIAGENFDRQQATPLQFVQNGQQGIAVFAAGQANQPFWLGAVGGAFDHAEILDRLAGLAHDPFAQLAELRAAGGAMEKRVDIVCVVQHERGIEDAQARDKTGESAARVALALQLG